MANTPKAPPKKVTPPAKLVEATSLEELVLRLTNVFGGQAAATWLKIIFEFQHAVNITKLEKAIETGNVDKIAAALAPTNLQAQISEQMTPIMRRAVAAAGQASADALNSTFNMLIMFDEASDGVTAAARRAAGNLVQGVPKDVKDLIRETIARANERGISIDQQARSIRDFIGLAPNWARAVYNLEDELDRGQYGAALQRSLPKRTQNRIRSYQNNDRSMSTEVIGQIAASYTETLIASRARTIARTETARALNSGLAESWQQAKDQGVFPMNTRMFWIVTEDDVLCPICAAIPDMNPNGVNIGDPFITPEGYVDMPPAPHPNCRCTVGLGFPNSNSDTEDSSTEDSSSSSLTDIGGAPPSHDFFTRNLF